MKLILVLSLFLTASIANACPGQNQVQFQSNGVCQNQAVGFQNQAVQFQSGFQVVAPTNAIFGLGSQVIVGNRFLGLGLGNRLLGNRFLRNRGVFFIR